MPGRLSRTAAAITLLFVLIITGCAARDTAPDGPWQAERVAEANRRGVEAYNEGRYSRAEGMFLISIRATRSMDDRAGEARALVNLARVYAATGRVEDAGASLDGAITLARAEGMERTLSEALATRAKADFIAGDLDAALKELEESLKIDGRLGYKNVGSKLNLKSLVLIEQGRVEEAAETLDKALGRNRSSGDRSEEANTLRAMAEVRVAQHDTDGALELLEKAHGIDKALGDTVKVAWGLERMAGIHAGEGRYAEAAFLLERSYRVNLAGGYPARALADLDNLIRAYSEMGEADRAEELASVREDIVERIPQR